MATDSNREALPETAEDDERDELDELDELIAEETKKNPEFRAMVEAALRRRQAARARGEDPNDISWDDDEAQENTSQQPSATSR